MPYDYGIYFITFTCYHWLSLIEITDGYDLVYKSFDSLKDHGHYIIGYVIMPNHVHFLAGFHNNGKNLNKMIGESKRFMAYEIVDRLKVRCNKKILFLLSKAVASSRRRKGKLHTVWEDSFDWKTCDTFEIIDQKLDYIHNNPCKGKWKLAESPIDYIHSSAGFYITGDQGLFPVTNYMELEDIDLTRPNYKSSDRGVPH
jgi:REP element-mobilizing transposase RayT